MKRVIDIVLALLALILLLPIFLGVGFVIRLTSKGPILYWSDRVGRHSVIFKMPKFRTMMVETPVVATHLLQNPSNYMTPIGHILRKYSLDELPQILSILMGHMSFIGPRPALFNQYDLINIRQKLGIDKMMPGLTGWAQVNGRDELTIESKVEFEIEYLYSQSFIFDLRILILTFINVLFQKGVKH